MNPLGIIRNDIAERVEAIGYCLNGPKVLMDLIDAADVFFVPRAENLMDADMRFPTVNPYHDLQPLIMRDPLDDGDSGTVRSASLLLHDLCFYVSMPVALVTTLPCAVLASIIRGE